MKRTIVAERTSPRWPNKVFFELTCGHRVVCDKTAGRVPRAKTLVCHRCDKTRKKN